MSTVYMMRGIQQESLQFFRIGMSCESRDGDVAFFLYPLKGWTPAGVIYFGAYPRLGKSFVKRQFSRAEAAAFSSSSMPLHLLSF